MSEFASSHHLNARVLPTIGCVYDEKTAVVHELTQQLKANLHSHEARDTLIQKILPSYDNALFALQSGSSSGKGSTTWDDQVIAYSDYGLDGDINNDGFSWRKYGQKDIQGANFPRSYYRCSYRDVKKCFATKLVQRSDGYPKVFDIKYKGKHTCSHGAQSASPPPPSLPSTEKHEIMPTYHQLSQPSPGETLSKPGANTLDLGDDKNTSFSFPSEASSVMDHFPNFYDDELLPIFSPPFISPVTLETNIFREWEDAYNDFEFNNYLF
ncbi:putative WRKY transcription factor 53 [Bidens hawaiensis]|uniref:putative WRKY transcription factor 53 n=1 Tax=Bidens hawaiensis TaxID=980011 RepID=UPI00404AE41B